MIDERITKTLSELETSLRNIESARTQVEKIVNSYDGLKTTTAEYVTALGNITEKMKAIIDSVGSDYAKRIKSFEKERETIVSSTKDAIDSLSNATESFKKLLNDVQIKLKYSFIINVVSLIAIIVLLIIYLTK